MNATGSRANRLLAAAAAHGIVGALRLLTGVQTSLAEDLSSDPTVYFANHTSHGDFVLVWAALPHDLRRLTRPVAAQDYWTTSATRRFLGTDVFHALLIRRHAAVAGDTSDPVDQMVQALAAGDSLIMFPEGTRKTSDDEALLPLKSGLFHIAQRTPHVRLTPVWIENLRRVLPKGSVLPIPLACTVRFGAPLPTARHGADKAAFLAAAREALLALRPEHSRDET